jgi:iron complex outermembrane recepter protein
MSHRRTQKNTERTQKNTEPVLNRVAPWSTAAGLLLVLLLPASVAGQTRPPTPQDLKRLSIEELAEIDVTSVSRRSEQLNEAAAAVSVLRGEDVLRSGAVSLAEAMRLADGLDVARADSRTWAISARGFTITSANKLLVLVDGRTVYSPLFAGTFWDTQDALLADLDRIEVVRGPGGSIWGANAVNGVVNVISKSAAETRGNVALLAAGSGQRVVAGARHGGAMRGGGSYRVYGKYRGRGAQVLASGASADDDVDFGQGGFRVESPRGNSFWFVQGDLYSGREGQFGRDDTDVSGGNVLGRWVRATRARGQFQLQAFYDRTLRLSPGQFEERRHTVEVDSQQRLQLPRHDVVFGGAVRFTKGVDLGTPTFFFSPDRRTDGLFSVFVEDQIAIGSAAHLIAGSKFERNDLTGLEMQPAIRVRWTPAPRQNVWAAVSRAVRLPTRLETDIRITAPVRLEGSEDFKTEHVVAYEAGYRAVPARRVSLDVAAFVNRYDDLRSTEQPLAAGDPILLGNSINALTRGVEVSGVVQVLEAVRIHSSYAYLFKRFSLDAGSRDASGGATEGNDPSHRFLLRAHADPMPRLQLDAIFRRVGLRPAPVVPAYSELDLRAGFLVKPAWELSLVGQNLLHDRHPEFGAPLPTRVEFRRAVYLRSLWRF